MGRMEKSISLLLALVMVLGLLPGVTLSAHADAVIPYVDASGAAQEPISTYTELTGTVTEWTDGWYVLTQDVTYDGRISVTGADVHLILCDGATLSAVSGGIVVPQNCALTIWGQANGTGKLTAKGSNEAAGIGSRNGGQSGNITINSGTVNATGGYDAAGIGGGGDRGHCGNVTINGGTVTAKGGESGAGIGGGHLASSGVVTINGGAITANGGYCGAGIGCSTTGIFDTIVINGGTVTAKGGYFCAGIGGARSVKNGQIQFLGGVVNATGGSNASAIGNDKCAISFDYPGSGYDMRIYAPSYAGDIRFVKEFVNYPSQSQSFIGRIPASSLAGVTLVPQAAGVWNVSYDANGGTGSMSTQTMAGCHYTLPACGFTAPSAEQPFHCWGVTVEGETPVAKQPGDTILVSADTTVKAVWQTEYAVSFFSGLGSGTMSSDTVPVYESYTLPANGFTPPYGTEFYSWEVTVGAQTPVLFQPGDTVTVTEDTTVCAIYTTPITTWAGLQAALSSATDGKVITLYSSITAGSGDTMLQLTGNKAVTVDLNGFTLNRNRSAIDPDGHVFIVRSGSTLTIRDSSGNNKGCITGGWANNGGAINNQGTLIIEGGTFLGNNAGNGGAICNRASLTVNGGVFQNNVITGGGGAIWSEGTAEIRNATIMNNTGAINGGAIVNHGTMTVRDCLIYSNSASAAGGAIFSGNNNNANVTAYLTVTGGLLMSNTAPLGGGIYIDSDVLNLNGCAIMSNTASDKGGGVYLHVHARLNAERAGIVSNTGGDGGGVFVAGNDAETYAKATLVNSNVSRNETTVHGGGGLTSYGDLFLIDCIVEDNEAVGAGGGVFNANELTIRGGIVKGNSSGSNGGGVCNANPLNFYKVEATVFNCEISENSANDGGGMYIGDTNTASLPYTYVDVSLSGAVYVCDNLASAKGGGIRNGSILRLRGSVTVTGNQSQGVGSGIWNGDTLTMQETIVVSDNVSSDAPLSNNVYLPEGKVITLSGALTADSSIGVTSALANAVLTSGYSTYLDGIDPSGMFFTNEGYVIRVKNEELCTRLTQETTYYDPISGTVKTQAECLVVDPTATQWANDWYVVTGSVRIDSRVSVSGDVNLILTNGAELTVPKGISVPQNANFTVWGQVVDYINGNEYKQAGILYTFGYDENSNLIDPDRYCAGIGGYFDGESGTACGNITINGGRISAVGGNYGPGIGTTFNSDGTTAITVNNGLIVSNGGGTDPGDTSGCSGAGIGGGYCCTSPRININGGGISAQGSGGAAGIGGGYFGYYWPITITGGEVYAFGAPMASGIGLGAFEDGYFPGYLASNFDGALIDIRGGKVFAESMMRTDNTYDSAGAFVYGESDPKLYFDGGLGIFDGAKVTYIKNWVSGGSEPEVVFTGSSVFTEEELTNRTGILMSCYRAIVEPCDHATATYTLSLTPSLGHTMHCPTCNLPETLEPHTYDSAGKCTLCGYQSAMYTVSFAANGGSGTMEAVSVIANNAYVLPECGFTVPEGKIFKEWSVVIGSADPVTKAAGDTITVTADTTVTAVWATLKFVGHSLSLKGDIGVNFYVDESVDAANARVVLSWGSGVNAETQTYTFEELTATDGAYKFTANVAAKQMNDTVTAILYVNDTVVERSEYSVVQYANRIIANTGGEFNSLFTGENAAQKLTDLQNLCRAMLIYGAKAQAQFGYNTDSLADADLGAYTLSAVDASSLGSYGTADLSDFGLTFTSSCLALESKTSHKLYFDVTDQDALDATTITCGSLTLERGTDSNGFYVIIPNMAARNVLKNYTLTFAKNGETTVKLKVNVGAYIGIVLDDAQSSASLGLTNEQRSTLKNTVTALYWYSTAAEAYFAAS